MGRQCTMDCQGILIAWDSGRSCVVIPEYSKRFVQQNSSGLLTRDKITLKNQADHPSLFCWGNPRSVMADNTKWKKPTTSWCTECKFCGIKEEHATQLLPLSCLPLSPTLGSTNVYFCVSGVKTIALSSGSQNLAHKILSCSPQCCSWVLEWTHTWHTVHDGLVLYAACSAQGRSRCVPCGMCRTLVACVGHIMHAEHRAGPGHVLHVVPEPD